jgi:hypothetical protein
VKVFTFAPEQARLRLLTPPPMWISAAVLRWQRLMVSDTPPLSLYAAAPPASTLAELLLLLPAQRPPSPEMYESPTLTTHGLPTPGPSACTACDPATGTTNADASSATAIPTLRMHISFDADEHPQGATVLRMPTPLACDGWHPSYSLVAREALLTNP